MSFLVDREVQRPKQGPLSFSNYVNSVLRVLATSVALVIRVQRVILMMTGNHHEAGCPRFTEQLTRWCRDCGHRLWASGRDAGLLAGSIVNIFQSLVLCFSFFTSTLRVVPGPCLHVAVSSCPKGLKYHLVEVERSRFDEEARRSHISKTWEQTVCMSVRMLL